MTRWQFRTEGRQSPSELERRARILGRNLVWVLLEVDEATGDGAATAGQLELQETTLQYYYTHITQPARIHTAGP
jgi:hypothetical protein